MSEALERDKALTLKISSQIELMRRYKDSDNLESLMAGAETLLSPDHIVIPILRSIYAEDASGVKVRMYLLQYQLRRRDFT